MVQSPALQQRFRNIAQLVIICSTKFLQECSRPGKYNIREIQSVKPIRGSLLRGIFEFSAPSGAWTMPPLSYFCWTQEDIRSLKKITRALACLDLSISAIMISSLIEGNTVFSH